VIAHEPGSVPLRAWLGLFGAMRAYHRYDVVGLDRILALRGPALLVGYHGRPIAYDLCMLGVTLHERLGYLPHGIVHGAVDAQPVMKWVADGLGFVTGDGPAVEAVVARGEHLCVQPGGTREGCRSFRHRYEVDWGDRTGYLTMALRHGLPIVPIAATGIDDGYVGLNDGYALGKRLGAPGRLPLWLGIGLFGPFPFSPPLPVKITQLVGEPLHLEADGPVDRGDRRALLRLHAKVKGAVQALLDAGRGR
jgi:1-acyl-sn-glycerol-3-phosphate acyltransferase